MSKFRSGFVSNSSSSSFIIIGKEIVVEDIMNYDNVYFGGGWLSEGQDIFELNDEFKKAILENHIHGEYYSAHVAEEAEDNVTIKKSTLENIPGDDITIHVFEKDYHTSGSRNVEDFVKRYTKGW